MGLSKEEKKLFAQITASLDKMNTPSAAQSFLDTQAMAAGNWIAGGDYRTRPSNAFIAIEDPAVENDRRRMMMDSAGSGTSALASGGADPTAIALNSQYLNDRWARDSAANYQNQVAGVADRATGAVANSANSAFQRQSAVLQGQMGAMGVAPKKSNLFGQILQGGLQVASAFL
jgi:hypothetical protein